MLERFKWYFIELRFRILQFLAIKTQGWSALGDKIKNKLGYIHRWFVWETLTARAPLILKARKDAGCKDGCTIDPFPHPGRECFTVDDTMELLRKSGYLDRL